MNSQAKEVIVSGKTYRIYPLAFEEMGDLQNWIDRQQRNHVMAAVEEAVERGKLPIDVLKFMSMAALEVLARNRIALGHAGAPGQPPAAADPERPDRQRPARSRLDIPRSGHHLAVDPHRALRFRFGGWAVRKRRMEGGSGFGHLPDLPDPRGNGDVDRRRPHPRDQPRRSSLILQGAPQDGLTDRRRSPASTAMARPGPSGGGGWFPGIHGRAGIRWPRRSPAGPWRWWRPWP